MRIIYARDYGTRVVLGVCHNPDAPKWVHTVGETLRDTEGIEILDDSGGFVLIKSSVVAEGETGETCHNCHMNWDVSEVILEGSDLYHPGIDGELVRFTDDELAESAFIRAAKPPAAIVLIGLEGRDG